MQEEPINIENLNLQDILTRSAEIVESAVRGSCEMEMEMMGLDYRRRLFDLGMEKLVVMKERDQARREIGNLKSIIDLITLERDQLQQNDKYLKLEIKELNSWIYQLQQQISQLIRDHSTETTELTQKLSNLQTQLKTNQQNFAQALKKLKSQKQTQAANFKKQAKQHEEERSALQSYADEAHLQLSEIKSMIWRRFSQFKKQERQSWTQEALIDVVRSRLMDLEYQQKQIQGFCKSKEAKNAYEGIGFAKRIEAICEQSQKKAVQFEKYLIELEQFLNNELNKTVRKYENCYGADLKAALANKFIDLNCEIEGLKLKIGGLQNKKCMECQLKDNEMKILRMDISKQRKKVQQAQKTYIQTLKISQKQTKQSLSILSKQKEKLTNQLTKAKGDLRRVQETSKIQEDSVEELEQKLEEFQGKCQELGREKRELEQKLEESRKLVGDLNRRVDDLKAQLVGKQKVIQQGEKNLKRLELQHKQFNQTHTKTQQSLQSLNQSLTQSLTTLQSTHSTLQSTHTTLQSTHSTLQQKYSQKLNELDQIDNKVCKLVNTYCLGKDDVETQNYRQAFVLLGKFLDQGGHGKRGKGDQVGLFKIPCISWKFQENMGWVVDVIAEGTGAGKNFTTKFIAKIQQGADFNKYFQQPNIVLLCQNSKGHTFQLLITQISKTISDRHKILLFSGQKKLRYPNPEQPKPPNLRPSAINSLGQLIFGKQEIVFNRNMEMTVTTAKAGYFGAVDVAAMFGLDSQKEKLLLEVVEVYQIVYL